MKIDYGNHGPGLQQLGEATRQLSGTLAAIGSDMESRNLAELDRQYQTNAMLAQLQIERFANEWMSNPANLQSPDGPGAVAESVKQAVNDYYEKNKNSMFGYAGHADLFAQSVEQIGESLSIKAMQSANSILKDQTVAKSTRAIEELATEPEIDFFVAKEGILGQFDVIESISPLKDREGLQNQALRQLFDTWLGSEVNELFAAGVPEEDLLSLLDGIAKKSYEGPLSGTYETAIRNLDNLQYDKDRAESLKKSVRKETDAKDQQMKDQLDVAVTSAVVNGTFFDTAVIAGLYSATAERNRLPVVSLWKKAIDSNEDIWILNAEQAIRNKEFVESEDIIANVKNPKKQADLLKKTYELRKELRDEGKIATVAVLEPVAANIMLDNAITNAEENDNSAESVRELVEVYVDNREALGFHNSFITTEYTEVVEAEVISEPAAPASMPATAPAVTEAPLAVEETTPKDMALEEEEPEPIEAEPLVTEVEEEKSDAAKVVQQAIEATVAKEESEAKKRTITSDMRESQKVDTIILNASDGFAPTSEDMEGISPEGVGHIKDAIKGDEEKASAASPMTAAAIESMMQSSVVSSANKKVALLQALQAGSINAQEHDDYLKMLINTDPLFAPIDDSINYIVRQLDGPPSMNLSLSMFAQHQVASNPKLLTDDVAQKTFVENLETFAIDEKSLGVLSQSKAAAKYAEKSNVKRVTNQKVGEFMESVSNGEYDFLIMWSLLDPAALLAQKTDNELLDAIAQLYTGRDYKSLSHDFEKDAITISANFIKAANSYSRIIEESFGVKAQPVLDIKNRRWLYKDPDHAGVYWFPENYRYQQEGGSEGISWAMMKAGKDAQGNWDLSNPQATLSMQNFVFSGGLAPGQNYVTLSATKEADKLSFKVEKEKKQLSDAEIKAEIASLSRQISAWQGMNKRRKDQSQWTQEDIDAMQERLKELRGMEGMKAVSVREAERTAGSVLIAGTEGKVEVMEKELSGMEHVLNVVEQMRIQLGDM